MSRLNARTGQQFLRVRRRRPRGQDRELLQRRHGLRRLEPGALAQHRREPDRARQAEQRVLDGLAEVRIDQQRVLAELREQHGQVGGGEAAPDARFGADDRQRLPLGALVEPAQQHLRADLTQRFDGEVSGPEGRDDIRRDRRVADRQDRMLVLTCEREADVVLRQQAELEARLAETHAALALHPQDAIGVFGTQPSRVDQQCADRPVAQRHDGARGAGWRGLRIGVHARPPSARSVRSAATGRTWTGTGCARDAPTARPRGPAGPCRATGLRCCG